MIETICGLAIIIGSGILFGMCVAPWPKMTKGDWIFVAFGCLLVVAGISSLVSYNYGEKRGCVDAVNGRPAYILTTQPDGSTTWARQQEKEAK
jgi:hypothetical protein